MGDSEGAAERAVIHSIQLSPEAGCCGLHERVQNPHALHGEQTGAGLHHRRVHCRQAKHTSYIQYCLPSLNVSVTLQFWCNVP